MIVLSPVDSAPGPQAEDAVYLDVPMVVQERNSCGAASLAMVFKYWGREISQYAIAAAVDHWPGEGLKGEDLRAVSDENGFKAVVFRGELELVKDHLRKGRPLVVAIGPNNAKIFHYIVLVGYDDASSVVLANDPQAGKIKRITYAKFLQNWRRSRNWSLLVVPGEGR